MANDTSFFLTPAQAVKAICEDFQQYAPQLLLFSEILPIITDDKFHLKREPGRNGAWINTGTHGHMRWLADPDLVAHMCQVMTHTVMGIDKLATVCARVFQSSAAPGVAAGSNNRGVLIETGMAHYQCHQCGRCCRELDYQNEITTEDIQRWRNMGRQDILDWVNVSKFKDQTTYRIWVHPGSGKLASQCPFLKAHSSENLWSCRIHEVKPAICRNYPVSRKHGLMTGCLGFTQPEIKT